MIGSLRGVLLERSGDEVVVEVAGVGYRVTVGPDTSIKLGEIGDGTFIHIHHHIREDAQTLYGFATREERICFEALISAHGVGPALGLAILSVHDPAALRTVLATDDIASLCLVPGVGKKTAARLLVELKSKLDLPELEGAVPSVSDGVIVSTSAVADVHDALAGLGYGSDEIRSVLRELPADGDSSLLLKEALQKLAVAS